MKREQINAVTAALATTVAKVNCSGQELNDNDLRHTGIDGGAHDAGVEQAETFAGGNRAERQPERAQARQKRQRGKRAFPKTLDRPAQLRL